MWLPLRTSQARMSWRTVTMIWSGARAGTRGGSRFWSPSPATVCPSSCASSTPWTTRRASPPRRGTSWRLSGEGAYLIIDKCKGWHLKSFKKRELIGDAVQIQFCGAHGQPDAGRGGPGLPQPVSRVPLLKPGRHADCKADKLQVIVLENSVTYLVFL